MIVDILGMLQSQRIIRICNKRIDLARFYSIPRSRITCKLRSAGAVVLLAVPLFGTVNVCMYVCVRGGPNQPLHRDPQWSIVLPLL
jgi:hypothetical protein